MTDPKAGGGDALVPFDAKNGTGTVILGLLYAYPLDAEIVVEQPTAVTKALTWITTSLPLTVTLPVCSCPVKVAGNIV